MSNSTVSSAVVSVVLASKPETLTLALAGKRSATVEAEFGSITVRGSKLTFAHHGANAGQSCPCSYPNSVAEGLGVEVVGISHVDLDTIGGLMAILAIKPDAPGFWALAEFVDLAGAHKLGHSKASAQDLAMLHAYWAWNESHKVFPNRDGSVREVREELLPAFAIIQTLLGDDSPEKAELLRLGAEFEAANAQLNAESLIRVSGYGEGIIALRSSPKFVNHLYAGTDGTEFAAVVAYNSAYKSVTLSFSNGQANACQIVQSLWGSLAGGHAGIAGSPRGREMTMEDAEALASAVYYRLNERS